MNIKPIRSENDYRETLKEVSRLFDAPPEQGTAAGDRFEVLLALVGAYEAAKSPVPSPDPIEAIRFRMDQGGLTPKDLIPFIGNRNRVSEVLNGKRRLSLGMMRRLMKGLGISGDVLLNQPSTTEKQPTGRDTTNVKARKSAHL